MFGRNSTGTVIFRRIHSKLYATSRGSPLFPFGTERNGGNFLTICQTYQFSVSYQPKTITGCRIINEKRHLLILEKPLPSFNDHQLRPQVSILMWSILSNAVYIQLPCKKRSLRIEETSARRILPNVNTRVSDICPRHVLVRNDLVFTVLEFGDKC